VSKKKKRWESSLYLYSFFARYAQELVKDIHMLDLSVHMSFITIESADGH
jgi:hypothetical protein